MIDTAERRIEIIKYLCRCRKTTVSQLAFEFNVLSNRNDWKYIGVWERGNETSRLHFHALVKAKKQKAYARNNKLKNEIQG